MYYISFSNLCSKKLQNKIEKYEDNLVSLIAMLHDIQRRLITCKKQLDIFPSKVFEE